MNSPEPTGREQPIKKKQRIIPPERRKKVAKACDSCKRRKQKCNGLLPCELCTLKRFKCEYTSIDRRVLKPSKKQLEERRRSAVSNENSSPVVMEEEVKSIKKDTNKEKIVEQQSYSQHHQPSESHYYPADFSYPIQNPTQIGFTTQIHQSPLYQARQQQQQTSSPLHLPQLAQQHRMNRGSLQQHPHNHQKPDSSTGNQQRPSISSSLQSLLSFSVNIHPLADGEELKNEAISAVEDGQNSRILFDSFGNLCYFGECSPTSYHLQIQKLFETVLGPNVFSFNPEKKPMVENKIFQHVEKLTNDLVETSTNRLPDKQYADYLLKTYLNNSNNIVNIIDDEELKLHLDRVYSNPSKVSRRDLCVLNLVFGIASIYAKVELSKNIFPFQNELFIDPQVFYNFAKLILTENIEGANIWLVEAHLLSFFYLQYIGKRNTAWIELGLAIRYAQSLGLNRKHINESFKDANTVLHRRKLFRSLFIMDRLSSIYLGRSMTIPEEDWDDVKSFENITDFQSTLLEVARLNGKVLTYIYYNPSINLKLALELQVELRNHSLTNPIKPLNPENYSRPVDHRYFLPHICHLHGIILLSRPFFQFIVLQKFGIIQYDKNSKNYIHLRDFYQSCIKSSLLIIKIVEYVYYQNIHPFKPLSLISCAFHAALVIGVVLLLKFKNIDDDILNHDEEKEVFKNIDSMIMESMNSVINMLHSYGEIDTASKSYAVVLENILKVTSPERDGQHTESFASTSNEGNINDNSANQTFARQMGNSSYKTRANGSKHEMGVNNQANYLNILKFKDWLFPKLDTQLPNNSTSPNTSADPKMGNNYHNNERTVNALESHDIDHQEEFLKDISLNNRFKSSGPKFLDDFYFSVLDDKIPSVLQKDYEPPRVSMPVNSQSPLQYQHQSQTQQTSAHPIPPLYQQLIPPYQHQQHLQRHHDQPQQGQPYYNYPQVRSYPPVENNHGNPNIQPPR